MFQLQTKLKWVVVVVLVVVVVGVAMLFDTGKQDINLGCECLSSWEADFPFLSLCYTCGTHAELMFRT